MSYMRVHGYDAGRILAAANPGDVVSLGEIGTIINNAAAQTLAAAALAGQVIIRQGAGVVNDVTDTAVNIIQALYGNTGSEPRVGEGFLCWYSNWGASTVTITGGTGVTVTGNTAALTLTSKVMLFICTAPGVKTYANGVYTNVGATFTCQVL
jgi:hypothetical protein